MFFYLSKTIGLLVEPSVLLTLVLLLGTALLRTRATRLARGLIAAGVAGLLIGGCSPLGNALILPLEGRFAAADLERSGPVAGIVLLGGAEDTRVSAARGIVALNEAGERLTEAMALARRFPAARVLFSGGATEIVREPTFGADAAARFFAGQGLEPARLILERRSRNTWENALFSLAAAAPKPGERWLLVTSAWHMPRAIGCFRRAGFPVEPWPVDYRTAGSGDLWRLFEKPSEGLRRLDLVLREWAGLVVYRVSGRTDALLPGPLAQPGQRR
jgi:uncharacterized SAM-binding protein YcdF (DUF218 family)